MSHDRYQPGTEGDFEPGSMRNLAGIQSPDDMNDLELQLLEQLYTDVLIARLPDRLLSVSDLKDWHRRWLGNVYAWAGEERSINLTKGASCLQRQAVSRSCSIRSSATVLTAGRHATASTKQSWSMPLP